MQDVIEHFNSINQFIVALENRTINDYYKGFTYSTWSGRQATNFTKTQTFETAKKLLINGYDTPIEELKTAKCTFTKKRTAICTNVTGYAPHVPNAIRGIPQAMISKKQIVQKERIINIFYSPTVNKKIKGEQVIKAGQKMLAVINKLESDGYQINLNIACKASTFGGIQNTICSVNVKKAGERLNYTKVTFPLVHPSFQRRLGFRWLETVGQTLAGSGDDYGRSLYTGELKKIIKDKKVVTALDIIRYNKTTDDILNDLQH